MGLSTSEKFCDDGDVARRVIMPWKGEKRTRGGYGSSDTPPARSHSWVGEALSGSRSERLKEVVGGFSFDLGTCNNCRSQIQKKLLE